MGKHIKLIQTVGQENNVPAQLITKLYTLYNNQLKGLDSWDCDEDSIQGTFKTGYTYDTYVDALHSFFNNLNIIPEGYYVYFEDPVVESTILNQLVNVIYPEKHYEGVIKGLEVNNSGNANYYGFRQIFKGNNEIQTFDELSKLTNVKALANNEFSNSQSLASIDLTNIETFGYGVFEYCSNLEYFNGQNSEKGSLRLPNLKSNGFGAYSFRWGNINNVWRGPKVKKIYDLGNCTSINGNMFYHCSSLEYIEDGILEQMTRIEDRAFERCENLIIDDLKLPNVTTIGKDSFYCTQIKKISELGNCTIWDYAFEACDQLTSISTEALTNISKIGTGAFKSCTNLVIDDLSLPQLTEINDDAFRECKIKTISNLGNVTTVTGFTNCTTLTSVSIPLSANTLGYGAFMGCVNLTGVDDIINRITYFHNDCLSGILTLPSIIYIKASLCGYRPFKDSNVRSMYLPNITHTNGISGYNNPVIGRNDQTVMCGSTMDIYYLKNIRKINGWLFGGRAYAGVYATEWDVNLYYNKNYEGLGRHFENNTMISEYQGAVPFEERGQRTDPWGDIRRWANIKYLVINNTTPPQYWQSTYRYGDGIFSSISLYMKDENGSNETFHYLVVPRSAINEYLTWDAINPDLSSPNLDNEYRQKFTNITHFTNDSTENRIIALESMGHFTTKAEYDAAPDMPDEVHSKNEYLIEEYMGLLPGETINWDSTPTWSA